MKPKFFNYDRKLHDAWQCPGKGPHVWTYHRETTSYHCGECFLVISKTDLKRETDEVQVAE